MGDYANNREREYEEYFSLYDQYLELGEEEGFGGLDKGTGVLFIPLGFIPGDAVILRRLEDGKLERVDATDVIRAKVRLPEGPISMDDLPDVIRKPLEEWAKIVEHLGHDPSPYNLGLTHGLLSEGRLPKESSLTIALPQFQPPEGGNAPFGITFVPDWGGVKVEKVYNPSAIPDVPQESEFIALSRIQEKDTSPLSKILRTAVKMENSYNRLFGNEDGV